MGGEANGMGVGQGIGKMRTELDALKGTDFATVW